MNIHEERAWRILVELGAKETMIGGKHALDVSPIRITNARSLVLFVQSILAVVGNSKTNRRHQDRTGAPIYVVTDDYTLSRDSARTIRVGEDQTRSKRLQAGEPLELRPPHEDVRCWRASASMAGIPLSEWIQRQCNKAAVQKSMVDTIVRLPPTEVVTERRPSRDAWPKDHTTGGLTRTRFPLPPPEEDA